jgi:heme A synthase
MTEHQPQGTGKRARDLSQRAHRRLIGILGFLLPGLLYLMAGLRPTEGLQPWRCLTSVSSYYYTGAVEVFVGVLFALSLFLFSYRGYKNDKADRVLGKIGGAASLGVALFPTAAPWGLSEAGWWSPPIRVVHYASAVVLFVAFILFSIWLFRKSSIASRRDRPPDKQWRDRICLLCGIGMIICVLWAASSLFTKAPIFWPEALAIMAFAISWLVKGEAYKPFVKVINCLRSRRRV